MEALHIMFNFSFFIQRLKETISFYKNYKNFLENKTSLIKKEKDELEKQRIIGLIKEIFPKDTCIESGKWSWSKIPLDLVYPEALFFNPSSNSWVAVGIVFQISNTLFKEEEDLISICKKADINLICIDITKPISKVSLVKKIEESFEGLVVDKED